MGASDLRRAPGSQPATRDWSIALGIIIVASLAIALVLSRVAPPGALVGTSWIRFVAWGMFVLAGLGLILMGYLVFTRRASMHRLVRLTPDPRGLGILAAVSGLTFLVVARSGLFDLNSMGTSFLIMTALYASAVVLLIILHLSSRHSGR